MPKVPNFKTRNIAITDVETTGLDPYKHEITEIGLVLISQPSLEIIDTLDIKVKPTNLQNADPVAIELTGYSPTKWKNAATLHEGLKMYLEKVQDAIFCAHNVMFDLPFIKQACLKTKLENTLDYHNIDLPSLIWSKYRNSDLERLNLSKVAQFVGLQPEPAIHRAINGAKLEYELLKKLLS